MTTHSQSVHMKCVCHTDRRAFINGSVREYVFYIFFSKKHDFLRFFEMTRQKVVRSQ